MNTRSFDVVMLSTVHVPDDPRIFHREAKTLAAAGFSVAIIARDAPEGYVEGVYFESLPSPPSRLRRLLLGRELLSRALALNAKLYIFHDPELFGVALYMTMLGKKVVYDCHE